MARVVQKRYWVYFVVLLLWGNNTGFSQSSAARETESVLEQKQGVARLPLLEQLSWEYRRSDNHKAEQFASEGIRLARNSGDSMALYKINAHFALIKAYQSQSRAALAHLTKSINYFHKNGANYELAKAHYIGSSIRASLGQTKQSDSLLTSSIASFAALRDSTYLPQCLSIRGNHLAAQGKYEEAYQHYLQALQLCDRPSGKKTKPFVLLQLGALEYQLGKYAQALKAYLQILDIGGEDFARIKALSKISSIYQTLEDWDKALTYQQQALELTERLQIHFETALCLQSLGEIHQQKHNYGDALQQFERTLALQEQLKEEQHFLTGNTLLSLGEIHQKLGHDEQAIQYFERSIRHFRRLINEFTRSGDSELEDFRRSIGKAYLQIGTIFFHSEETERALDYARRGLTIAEQIQCGTLREIGHQLVAEIYTARGEKDQSYLHQAAYLKIRDSLVSLEDLRAVAQLESSVSFEQDTPPDSERTTAVSSSIHWGWILILPFLIGAGFLYLRSKQRPQQPSSSEHLPRPQNDRLDDYFAQLFQKLDALDLAESGPGRIKSMSGFLRDQLTSETDWEDFLLYFRRVHKDFFKDLKTRYPRITPNELNLCALLKLNIQNKEIAQLLGISPDSVRKAQHRLAQKMNLADRQSLRTHILQF